MKKLFAILSILALFLSCNKDSIGKSVEIYLLASSDLIPGQCAVNPATAVLENTPFIANDEILSYDKTACNYTLSASAAQKATALKPRATFALTVDKQVIFYGINMPSFLSSSCVNSIIMSSLGNELWLRLGYPGLIVGTIIDDQRNNSKIINALQVQGKLK